MGMGVIPISIPMIGSILSHFHGIPIPNGNSHSHGHDYWKLTKYVGLRQE